MIDNKNPVGETTGGAKSGYDIQSNGGNHKHYSAIEQFGVGVIRKLINGQDVEPKYIKQLPDNWKAIAEAVRVTPKSADQRTRAFEAAINGYPDRDDIYTAVFESSGEENLDELAKGLKDKRIFTADDALQPLEPVDWIVGDLITAGSVNIFYGAPGHKKTWAALDMAVTVALGDSWLGKPTKKSPVLIIDEESGIYRLKRRLGMVLRGHNAGGDTPITAHTMIGYDLREAQYLELLANTIQELGARLVIIDALVDVMLGGDENAVKDVQPLMHEIRKVANETNAAIALIHHANKAGGYRGSTALSGAVDCLVQVTSDSDNPYIEFEVIKSRDGELSRFIAKPSWIEDKFWLDGHSAGLVLPRLSDTQIAILKHVAELNGTVKRADIKALGYNDSTIKVLVDRGYLRRVNNGGSGTPAVFELTSKGEQYLNPQDENNVEVVF